MNNETLVALAIGVVTLVLQTIAMIITGTRKLSSIEAKLEKDINNIKFDNYNQMTGAVRNIGETFTAIRQKISEVELYMRDNYVPKDVLRDAIIQMGVDARDVGERIEVRMQRIEKKIDDNHRKNT
jgi:hypothetical protein